MEEVQRIGEEEARCTTRSSETHTSEAFQSFFIYHEPQERRQGPRFSIRMIIWIFCSDTETGAVTPLGRGAETLTALKM